MEGTQDLTKVVREEIGKVQETLKTHVSDEVSKKFAETQTTLAEVQAELGKRALAGESPKAEDVKDLEKRLIEAEKNIQEFAQRASQVAIGGEKNQEARDAEMFAGSLITNPNELRNRLRQMRDVSDKSVRAIDSSLFSTGGKLSAETADRFIDWLIAKQTALGKVTTRRMMANTGYIDELTISTRKVRKATEATAPSVAGAIGNKRRTLTTVEVIWAEDVTLTFLEDNIEKRGAEAHIARMLATQFGNDLNDLAWNGDVSINSTPDNFVETNNGWLAIAAADSDVEKPTVSGASSCTALLQTMYRAMPVEYLGLTDLGFFMPVPFCQRYAEEVSTRETAFGDQILVNGFPALRYFGMPVVPETHLYLTSADEGVLTPFSNLYHGIQRQITVDSEWKPRTRVVEFTITARNDYEYSTGKAIVLADSIPSGLR
jgi:hypothetical protein